MRLVLKGCPFGSQVAAVAARRRAEELTPLGGLPDPGPEPVAEFSEWRRRHGLSGAAAIVGRDPGDETDYDPQRER